MVNRVGCGIGGDEGEILRVVAVEDLAAAGDDPQEVSVQDGVGETEGVQVPDDGTELRLVFFIQEEGGGVAHQEPSVMGVPESVDIPAVAQDGDAAEAAVLRLDGDAVGGSGPQPALLAVEDRIDLVVRQAEGVVGTEVLVPTRPNTSSRPSA